jgi:predicted RNA polymerase sigma factor
MLFHGARLESRVGPNGSPILLEDQDRSQWDRSLIRVAKSWLAKSGGEDVSRFHFEAAIALEHCRADSFDETDWDAIVRIYDRLIELHPSPVYVLNRAIARGQSGEIAMARQELDEIADLPNMSQYFLIDCARARLFELENDRSAAIDCYLRAMTAGVAPHENELLKRKINDLS